MFKDFSLAAAGEIEMSGTLFSIEHYPSSSQVDGESTGAGEIRIHSGFDSQTQRNAIEEGMALNEGAGSSSCTYYSTEVVSYSNMEENEEAEGKNENVLLCLNQILLMSCNL